MEDKAIRGVPWTLLAYGSNKAITVATTLALARLLSPDDFGVVALALIVVVGVSFLRDLGLNGALVVRQDLDVRAQGTVLTLMVAMGVVLGAGLAIAAPLAARLFDEPDLSAVVRVMALSVLLGGFTWFYETLLQRELEFRRRFAALMAQGLTNAVVALPLAVLGAGVWSLVAGHVASTLVFGVALLALAPYRVPFTLSPTVARDVLRTGAGFLLQGLTAFIQQNADYFAVGRLLGATQVGFYSMAYRLAELPYYAIADPVARVTFPSFARMQSRGEDVRSSFLSALRVVALVSCCWGVVLSGAAEPFVLAVLGERWAPMAGALAVLGIWGSVRPLQVTVAWLLNAVGQAGLMGRISIAFLIPLVPLLLFAADRGGIEAVSWVMLGDMVLSLLILSWFAGTRFGLPMRDQARAIAPVVAACMPAWAIARAVSEAVDASAGVVLALAATGGLAAYGATITAISPPTVATAIAAVRRSLGRESPESRNS